MSWAWCAGRASESPHPPVRPAGGFERRSELREGTGKGEGRGLFPSCLAEAAWSRRARLVLDPAPQTEGRILRREPAETLAARHPQGVPVPAPPRCLGGSSRHSGTLSACPTVVTATAREHESQRAVHRPRAPPTCVGRRGRDDPEPRVDDGCRRSYPRRRRPVRSPSRRRGVGTFLGRDESIDDVSRETAGPNCRRCWVIQPLGSQRR